MKTIALIQTTRDRTIELKAFIKSLNSQKNINFSDLQYVFIDQGDNKSVFNDLNPEIEFIYIKSEPCSLSCARNIGIKNCNAKYISFPDDDCWYAMDTLSKVLNRLEQKNFNGIIIKATNEEDIPIGKFPAQSQEISLYNHCGACSITIFFQFIKDLLFDENLGVGSPYKFLAGEESDYIINFMRRTNGKVYYDSNICIHHPIGKPNAFTDYHLKKYYYGRGIGYLYRKQNYPISIIFKNFTKPLIGSFIYLMIGNIQKSKQSFYFAKGKIKGYLDSKKIIQ